MDSAGVYDEPSEVVAFAVILGFRTRECCAQCAKRVVGTLTSLVIGRTEKGELVFQHLIEGAVAFRDVERMVMRWLIHDLDPALESGAGNLTAYKNLDALTQSLSIHHGVVAEIAVDLVAEIRS